MQKIKHVLCLVVWLIFLMLKNSNTYAAVRVDNQYPLGGSSDFMMVSGNRFIHSGSPFSGRIMANSIELKTPYLGSPGFNGSELTTEDHQKYDDYFSNIWNPGVIINDFLKGDSFSSNNTNNLLLHLTNMWKTSQSTTVDKSNNLTFATDTTEDQAVNGNHPEKEQAIRDLWQNKIDRSEDGAPLALKNLTQYVDNGINKYETDPNNKPSDYSLQQNIQDISQFYASLTPSEGLNDNNPDHNFWSSDANIINYQPTINGKVQTNPTYLPDSWSDVTDVVINIVDKNDNPDKMNTSKYHYQRSAKKTIVAISIDRDKMLKVNPSTKHMNLVFNFSDSFYKMKDDKKVLDSEKLPYIVLNYQGFNDKRFDFQPGDGFYIGDINNRTFASDSNSLGKPGYVSSIATKLGATSPEEWSNEAVLAFGSRLLNNFTDVNDSDNYPESYDQGKRDNSGLTANTAAVSYTNRSPGTMLFGTMFIPHGSYYAGSSTNGLYIGGVVAANNITLDNAIISPKHDAAVFGRNRDFPDLKPAKKIEINNIELSDVNQENKQTANNQDTITFDYSQDILKPAPQLGITGTLHLSNVPDSYGLYYRVNEQGDWHRYSDSTLSNDKIAINEDFISNITNKTKSTVGNILTGNQSIEYPLAKQNNIEFATTNDANEEVISNENIKPTANFSFTLNIKGYLKVIVPEILKFDNNILGTSTGKSVKKIELTEVQSQQTNVANMGTTENPKIIVENPLLSPFTLKLAYLNRLNFSDSNPFYLENTFKYQLNNDEPQNMLNYDLNWTEGILSRENINQQSLFDKVTKTQLHNNELTFIIPFSNTYKPSKYTVPLIWQLTI